MATERSFTIHQIAQLLGATPTAVTEWVNNGQLTCNRFPNGPQRVSEQALIQFLKQQGIDLREILAKVALRQDLDVQTPADHVPAQQELPPPPTALPETPDMTEESTAQIAQAILQDALDRTATYIHLENQSDGLALRLRIHGQLREKINFKSKLPQHLAPRLIPHFKSLANLEPLLHPGPQTGKFKLTLAGREITCRLTSCPTIHGNKLLIRILDPNSELLDLSQLSFDAEDQIKIQHLLGQMKSLIIVAAPQHNGRATTLRAMLSQLDPKKHNILTIEKSADHQFQAVNQSTVDPLSGLTFAKAAATFSTLDPDAVMIQEIFDPPTAHAALQLAHSGSLVLAGINAPNAVDALAVLLGMGLEPYALATNIKAIIAQRILRKICPNCKQPTKPTAELLDRLALESPQRDSTFYTPKGCSSCSNSGYSGHVAIFQTLWLDTSLAKLLRSSAELTAIHHAAQEAGMKTLLHLACQKAASGQTTLEEIERVLFA